jgi:hypothetical protein
MLSRMLLVFLGAWAAIYGAENPVTGPVTGFIFDAQANAIRPMLGIPGAAYIGAPVVTSVTAAAVAPDGSAALAVRGGALVWYTGLRSGAAAGAVVDGAIGGVDRFAWAPDAGAAAIYSSKGKQAQVVRNGVAGAAIDLSGLPGPVTALAFDGQRIILGAAGGIFQSAQRIAAAGSPSAIALAGADLYFADAQSQEIWQVEGYAGQAAAVLFAKDTGLRSPVGLQLSADGQRLLAAGSREVAIYDVASRTALGRLPLDCEAAGLERFGDASVWLLNGGGHGPLYVLSDRGAEGPAIYFVPLPAAENWRQHLRPRAN